MVIVKFIQDGLKCHLEGETDTYKYSKNMEMQFVKDENHQDYEVTVFFLDQEKNEGKIDIDENGVFQLGERFFLRKEPFYLSFQLEKGDEIQHLGNYKMRVCDAIGNGSSPLPENPRYGLNIVDEEMDEYFKTNFQPKLDDFNQKYEEIKKIASSGGGSGSNVTVDNVLSSTSTNPVQNKVIKSELDKKASTDVATTSANGLMSKDDKVKMDSIATGANKTVVDSILSDTSTNPIQNQVVAKVLAQKANSTDLGINKYQKSETDATVVLENGSWTVFPTMTSLNVSMGTVNDGKAFICGFQFTSGDTATSLTLNNCTLTSNSDTVESNKTYEVNILDGSAIVREI